MLQQILSNGIFKSLQKTNDFSLFMLVCLLSAILFSYPALLNLPPQTLHLWRQSDCLAFALNYYDGQKFFEPRVYNYLNDNGLCAGECPLIYYAVGKIWQYTGVQYWIFKCIQLLIFYMGAWALFKLSLGITQSRLGSFFIITCYISAPLVMVYAPSFLADIPSLSFVWMGLLYFYSYQKRKGFINLLLTSICFLFAMLLKANAMFLPIAILLNMLLCKLKWVKENDIVKYNTKLIIAIATSIIVQYLWYVWVIEYTTIHRSSFLGTGTWPGWPIWAASAKDIQNTIKMLAYYAQDLFSIIGLIIALIALIFVFIHFFKKDALAWLIMTYLGAVLCFLLYFFVGFKDNNYYFVNLYVLPFLCLIFLVKMTKKYFEKSLIKLILLAIILFNFAYANKRMQVYFYNGKQHQKLSEEYYHEGFRNFIDKNLPLNAQVISFPDVTPNGTLSIIQRHGVSQYGFKEGKINEEDLQKMLSRKINYYLCNNKYGLSDTALKVHLDGLVGKFETLSLYKLK
jgi:hypothetical protein